MATVGAARRAGALSWGEAQVMIQSPDRAHVVARHLPCGPDRSKSVR